jgi:hypothetical protein
MTMRAVRKFYRGSSFLVFLVVTCFACAHGSPLRKPSVAPFSNTTRNTSGEQTTRPAKLPEASEPILAGIKLPPGRLVVPDPELNDGQLRSSPVLWITEKPAPDVGTLWIRLAAEFHTTGLWPLVLESLEDADDRPWFSGELGPNASSDPGKYAADAVLTNWWREAIPVKGEENEAFARLTPFGRTFPGLAPASESTRDDGAVGRVARQLGGRLGLVAAGRPADALSVIGWLGPVNYFSDLGPLSAVMRSWEDRFGAYLVGVGFDTVTLAVERPPRSIATSNHVAAEHFAACPDNIYQDVGSIEKYARRINGRDVWTFWWD